MLQPDFEHLWLEFPGGNTHSKILVGIFYGSTRILNTKACFEVLTRLHKYDLEWHISNHWGHEYRHVNTN